MRSAASATLLLLALGCGAESPGTDAGPLTALDAGPGAGPVDASPTDAGAIDGGPTESDAGTTMGGDVDAPGPFTVTTRSDTVMRGSRRTPVTVYDPGVAAPLVVFAPGFQLQASFYAATLRHVASHGFLVVGADPSASAFSPDHVAMKDDLIAVIDWAIVELDVDGGVVVAGHSLGGKLVTMVAAEDARASGLFAIDPVNGGSPISGYSDTLPDIVPSLTETLSVPVAYLGETTNATGGTFGMACAPADQNYQTFYEGTTAAAAVFEHTFGGADHMDFVDDTTGCGFACGACTEGTADSAMVSASTHALFAAFARFVLRDEAAMRGHLDGTIVRAGVTVRAR